MYVVDNNGFLPYLPQQHPYFVNEYLQQGNYRLIWSHEALFLVRPGSMYMCPAVSSAADSPCWDGSQAYSEYMTNYLPTVGTNGDSSSGGWIEADSAGNKIWGRMFDRITGNGIMIGEKNYSSSVASGQFNWNATRFFYTGWVAGGPVNNSQTAGFIHSKRSNMLFKDGHVSAIQNRCPLYDSHTFRPYEQ